MGFSQYKTLAFAGAALALFALLTTLAGPLPAHAQDGISVATLVVRVWPEFDRRAALVIYDGQVSPEVSVPVDIRLPLPPGVTVNAAAYRDLEAGGLFTAQTRREGDEIILSSPNGTFWLEYYDESLAFDGQTRRYELSLTFPFSINEMLWEVESPVGAQNLSVEPSAGGAFMTDLNGLSAYRVRAGSVPAGERVTLRFTYTKADDSLSIEQLPTPATAPTLPADTAPPAPGQPPTLVIAGLLVAGLAVIGLGVGWYLKHATVIGLGVGWYLKHAAPPGRSATRARGGGVPGTGRGGRRRYCTQCGEPVEAGDAFCRHCGAKLRG